MNNYKPGPKHSVNRLMPYEKQAVLDYVQLEETADYSLRVLDCKGAKQGLFYVSASTIRWILLDEGILSDRRSPIRRTGPNRCWCWDLSYIKTDLKRMFWYLYVMLDEWSSKNQITGSGL